MLLFSKIGDAKIVIACCPLDLSWIIKFLVGCPHMIVYKICKLCAQLVIPKRLFLICKSTGTTKKKKQLASPNILTQNVTVTLHPFFILLFHTICKERNPNSASLIPKLINNTYSVMLYFHRFGIYFIKIVIKPSGSPSRGTKA